MFAPKSTANPSSHKQGCEAALTLFKRHAHVPLKLSMHQSQQQTLKPQKRLRGCIDYAQMLYEHPAKVDHTLKSTAALKPQTRHQMQTQMQQATNQAVSPAERLRE